MEDGIKLISCDVFDTLFLRFVKNPKSVFRLMYEKNPDLFGQDITANGWETLRTNTERITKRKKNLAKRTRDVTIEEIYKDISNVLPNAYEIMKCEIETERALGFLNRDIWDFLEECHKNGKKIILTSDMYFSREIIAELLEGVGAKLDIIDEIFVSSDYEKTKFSGELFQLILNRYQLNPEEMFHLGDFFVSDIGVAKKMGIKTSYYTLISEAVYRMPELNLENLYYPECDGVLNLLRIIAAKDYDREDSFWEEIGASCLGPSLTGFAEWVVDYAIERGINNIYPMMREGDFLGKMIRRAAEEKGECLNVRNFYISRIALTRYSIQSISPQDIEYQARTHGISVGDVFDNLGIRDEIGQFSKYEDVQTSELNKVASDDGCMELGLDNLVEYLTSTEMIAKIYRSNADKQQVLAKYLEKLGILDGGMTIDVGWKGSLQNMLDKFFLSQKINNKTENLLFVASDAATENLIQSCSIKGYFGNHCQDASEIKQLYPRLMELFLGCDEGTTIGYEWDGDEVVAKTLQIDYPNGQREKIKRLQNGILHYQDCYYDTMERIRRTKCTEDVEFLFKLIKNTKKEQKKILIRLFSAPLKREALEFAQLHYDQNFGGNHLEPIISEKMLLERESMDAIDFWRVSRTTQIQWFCGINVLNDGLIYYKQQCLATTQFRYFHFIAMLEGFLKEINGKKFVLVCAGENLAYFLSYCHALEIQNRIEGIIDNDPCKQNTVIDHCEICEMGHNFTSDAFLITTLKEKYIYSLKASLKNHYGDKITIGSYC